MPAPIIVGDQSGLAEGIVGGSSSIAQALGQRRQQQQQQQYGSVLNQTLGQLPENASPMQVTQALTQAVNQGVPTDIAQNYGALYATLQKQQPSLPPGPDQINTMSNLFKKFGMADDVASRNAELWGNLTTGGQTEMAKMLVDQITRQQYSANDSGSQLGFQNIPEQTVVSEEEVEEYKFPKVNIFQERTPKERISLKTELLKSNSSDIKDNNEKLRKVDEEIMRYDQLERLNESGKLPSGLQRLNINWTTGDIRFPALANEETQQFVKTINDFTVAAKDTYGSRVTNFELGAFMKRLPTLANTEEGRRLILSQMKAMKGLDRLYNESIKKVYDHYGAQNIDSQNAEKIAADLRRDDEDKLKKDFRESIQAQEVFEVRNFAPEGKVPARSPEGKVVYVWRNQADKAEKRGYKLL